MYVPDLMFNLTVADVYTNGRCKVNPMTKEVMEYAVSSRPIFRAVEAVERKEDRPRARVEPEGDKHGTERSAARARKELFDLAACNPFELFITLTLDKEKVDRYDAKAVVRKMGVWLDNLVRRHGFAYLIVPERHKDGAIHFHGLCKADGLKLVPSGRRDKSGREVFNVANWRYGFTTAVRLDGDYGNVCKYITKYIGKDVSENGTVCGRYFYHGGELMGPQYVYFNQGMNEVEGKEVEIPEAGLVIKYVSV